jgi:predicted RNA-binding Zn-ribbon protein involved in translation (DUF1610 family)
MAVSPAYLVTVLFLAVAMAEVKTDVRYSCPTCGSRRAGRHSSECPWRRKP